MNLLDSGYLDIAKLKELLGISEPQDTRTYSADELSELNKVIAATGNYSALSDNVKAQLENTYTDEQKALRAWSNAKQAADKADSFGGLLPNAIMSALSAGVYDVTQGEMPGSAFSKLGPVASMLNPVPATMAMFTGGLSDLAYGIDKAGKTDGNLWNKISAGLDRAVDPNSMVDETTRYAGDALYSISPSTAKWIGSAGPLLGTAIGTAIWPGIGTAAGAAAGSGIGSKLSSGHRELDYGGDALKAGISAGAAYAGYGLSDLLSPVLGETLGSLAGKAGSLITKTGGNLLASYLNPKTTAAGLSSLAGLLSHGTADTTTTGLGTGTTSTASKAASSANLLDTSSKITPLATTTKTSLTPIDWTSQLKKLSMPIELKKKKDEDDEDYMSYTFKPKDYLVNYL